MLLRPRQKSFVARSTKSLNNNGNTLSVAPTGAGKTVMFCSLVGNFVEGNNRRAVILAHRDELTDQNHSQFLKINPSISTSIFDAKTKTWEGQVTFAMVQTLSREQNLETMPAIDLLVIDEAHHAVADTYQKIIDRARELNGDCRIFGVTATPSRSDRKGLGRIFSNAADKITVGELVGSGNLVRPRTFVMDVGVTTDLTSVKKLGNEFDMEAVDKILNTLTINEEVVRHWKDKAEGRQTVVFCSTVAHAEAVTDAFRKQCVKTVLITGELGHSTREERLREYASEQAKVIVNVAVLTEGWDHPPTSCVVLLRPSSAKSTMTQMIGRGLRTLDAEKFPGKSKTDCIVLDFGASSLTHGTLEQDIELDDGTSDETAELTMNCPSCSAIIPLSSTECPICGHVIERTGRSKQVLSTIRMMEINLLNRSSFEWVELFGDDASFISSGFDGWGGVFLFNGQWHAIGGTADGETRLLTSGSRVVCLSAADDWLNTHETEQTAHKTREWLQEPPTPRQIMALPEESRLDFNLTRYGASARITFEANKKTIVNLLTET